MLKRLFRRAPHKETARALYADIVAQARSPYFYASAGVPDTPSGRFEMVALHTALVLIRLKEQGDEAQRLSQALFDTMFRDFDGALREIGIGDLTVPKKIKKLTSAFYGRLQVYDEALAALDDAALGKALGKNVYGGLPADYAPKLAVYVMSQHTALEARPVSRFLNGIAGFEEPAPPPSETIHDAA